MEGRGPAQKGERRGGGVVGWAKVGESAQVGEKEGRVCLTCVGQQREGRRELAQEERENFLLFSIFWK